MEDRGMTLTATHARDTERFHRYNIDDGQEGMGHVYVEKRRNPERVTIVLRKGSGKGEKAARVFRDGGWYFWDEVQSERYGPYETEEEAESASGKYGLWLSGELTKDEVSEFLVTRDEPVAE